jgi:phosphatidylserine/phosphatidylglycerophosphate/cardiolipin synthase-like enzyme
MDNFTWVEASFAYDNPVPKDVNNSDEPKATAKLLGQMMYESDEEVIVESAYLVFDDSQLTVFQELIDTGSTLKALTNSMASNDLVTNHSAYAGRRKDMLEHGIELYELKPDSALCQASIKDENLCAPHVAYGLHAKSVVFDREAVGIGSFNFNLRSTYLNTESILIVKNEQIAEALAEDIENAMNTQNSWQLKLEDSAGHWYSDGKVWSNEPETGQWERAQSYFLQLLPIEKYL